MKINDYGEVVYSPDEIINFLLNGYTGTAHCDDIDEIEKFNDCPTTLLNLLKPTDGVGVESYHASRINEWNIPDEYKHMDVYDKIYSLCQTDEEIARVEQEIILFEKYKLHDMLRCILWIVNTMDHNNIIRGVGRGSSVASYSLYLLGIHMIDSIKYKLDIQEFLRDGD